MKKALSLAIVLVVLCTLLCGCAPIDVIDTIMQLKAKGMVSTSSYTTAEEVRQVTNILNFEVKSMKGDFTVEVVEQYGLMSSTNPKKICTFITFATSDQAKKYANRKLSQLAYDWESNYYNSMTEEIIPGYYKINWYGSSGPGACPWRVARRGCLVVITNYDLVTDTVPMRFKVPNKYYAGPSKN